MVKPFKNFFPGTSGTISTKLGMYKTHHNLLKLLTWVDFDLIFDKVKFCNLGFIIEKCNSDGFFGIFSVVDLETG